MLSEEVTPYLSDHALGAATSQVSFPVLIQANDVSYVAALAAAKGVFETLNALADRFQSDSIKTSMNPIEEKLGTETTVDLKHSRKHSTVSLYVSVNARFGDALDMWAKLEFITKLLDAIREFSSGYDSSKQLNVYVGVGYKGKRK